MRERRQAGSILVLALLVSAAAAVAVTADLRVRANRYLNRSADAGRVAVAGLQLSRERLGTDPDWPGCTVYDPLLPGNSVTLGATSTGVFVAEVTSLGAVADATQTAIAELRAMPHQVLDYNVFSASTVKFDGATTGGYVRANGDVETAGAVSFAGIVETVEGSTVSDTIKPDKVVFVPDVLSPPPVSIAAYAAVSSSLLGLPAGDKVLDKVSLRPDDNPYGAENADGAYVLDAGGAKVTLRRVYVEGTLTIRNASRVIVADGYHHRRVNPAYASLIVQGPMEFRPDEVMDEWALSKDFNGDGDRSDDFDVYVEGIIYTTGRFQGDFQGTIKGAVVADSVVIKRENNFRSYTLLLTQPVVEFIRQGAWDIVPGSIGGGTP
ncbi:MAG: hypothetical protein HY812_15805 [Planctomycetes bacterium]|nr:hypothetical protein [Planctomycetota bacterium]